MWASPLSFTEGDYSMMPDHFIGDALRMELPAIV